MGVFNFGDPANRRPAWTAAPWPGRRGAGTVVKSGRNPGGEPVESADCASRVLVVDDNPVHRMLTAEMLALWGIHPLLAVDGSEAVTLAREIPLALILMDLQMPVLDGLGATRQIRRLELERARPRIPIVAYTSLDIGSDRMRLEGFGLDDVLAKPCAAHRLLECLTRWCPAMTVRTASADLRDGDGDGDDARSQHARPG